MHGRTGSGYAQTLTRVGFNHGVPRAYTLMRNMAAPARGAEHWSKEYRQMVDDLEFLIGRPEEAAFVHDKMAEIRHRRLWVEEREAHERTRRTDQ